MDGKVSDHPSRNKLLLAVVPDHLRVLLRWDFFGQSQHKAPGQLGVPLFFGSLYRVPEGFPVSVFRWSMSGQHDFRIQDAALTGVVFGFLIVLRKQLLAALVGSTCHCRLSLAALGDGDLEMRTRNRYHLQNKDRPSGLLLTNGLESCSVVLSVQGWSGVRFGPGRELQKDSCGAAQGKCSFPWDGIGMANRTPDRFHQAVCKTAIAPERCIIAPYYNRVGTGYSSQLYSISSRP